eukprot:TRINITY_DN4717_c0_g2_i1.p1 TRINITY_DN4717_c0_g2~~TRINITY_DN4717_c0_g2_i1.p1  ORF type:complete len:494 (+),score=34.59 TRINITY_DN4717_c0_g2_i1:71-1552(+)
MRRGVSHTTATMAFCVSLRMFICVTTIVMLLHGQRTRASKSKTPIGVDRDDVVRLQTGSEEIHRVEVGVARMKEHLLENEVASAIELLQSERCRTYDLTRFEALRGRGSKNVDSSDRHGSLITRENSWLTRVSGRVLSHAKEIRASGAYVTMEDLVNCVPDEDQVPRFTPVPGESTHIANRNSFFCGARFSDEELKNRKSYGRSYWPCRVMPLEKAPVTPLSLRRCTYLVMSEKYRFIYVDNYKAGSTTTRDILRTVFDADYETATEDGLNPSIPELWPLEWSQFVERRLKSCSLTVTTRPSSKASPLRRNTKTGLLEFNPDDFFIFSLVRDPHERFFSGFGEADLQTCQWFPFQKNKNMLRKFCATRTDEEQYTKRVGRMLTMIESGIFPNEHVISQTTLLGATDSKGVQIPLDFIGRLETISADLNHIVSSICDRAASRGVTPLPARCLISPKDADNAKARGDPSYTRRICDLFAQDYECLGYPLPKECAH